MWVGSMLFCAALVAACGGDSVEPAAQPDGGNAPDITPDADTTGPVDVVDVVDVVDADGGEDADTVGPTPLPPFVKTVTWSWYGEAVDDLPRSFAAALGARVLVQRPDGTTAFVAANAAPDLLVGDPGTIDNAGRLADGMPVVHAQDGLHLLIEDTWYASPANDALTGIEVTDLVVEPRGATEALWLASASGLVRLFDDGVDLLTSDSLPTSSTTLALDRDETGAFSVWVGTADTVYELEDDGVDVGALHVADLEPGSLVATGGGYVWAATDSFVLRLGGDDFETRWAIPEDLGAPSAAMSGVDGAWIWFGSEPWYLEGETFGPLEPGLPGTPVDAASGGVLLIEDGEVLRRVQVGSGTPPPPPTWSGDIEAIAEARCWECHLPVGYTGPTQLGAVSDWQENAEKILAAIMGDEPAMPLGKAKLQNVQVAMIQAWMDAGFPASTDDLEGGTP